jgi:hypothetical protein
LLTGWGWRFAFDEDPKSKCLIVQFQINNAVLLINATGASANILSGALSAEQNRALAVEASTAASVNAERTRAIGIESSTAAAQAGLATTVASLQGSVAQLQPQVQDDPVRNI